MDEKKWLEIRTESRGVKENNNYMSKKYLPILFGKLLYKTFWTYSMMLINLSSSEEIHINDLTVLLFQSWSF